MKLKGQSSSSGGGVGGVASRWLFECFYKGESGEDELKFLVEGKVKILCHKHKHG